jgi:hypothetical protein
MNPQPWTFGNSLVGWDPAKRRVWLAGQRLHHGATGMVLAGLALTGLAAGRVKMRTGLPWTMLGATLAAHDWKDHEVWFQRGSQL